MTEYKDKIDNIIETISTISGCEKDLSDCEKIDALENISSAKFDKSFKTNYDDNISKKIRLAKERFKLLKKKKEINNSKLETNLNSNKAKSQMYKNKLKSDNYNYQKNIDNKKHYIIITILHIIILLFIFLGIFSIISPPITTLVLVIFYIIILSIIYFKLKKDEIRSPITYTSYNPSENKEEICKL